VAVWPFALVEGVRSSPIIGVIVPILHISKNPVRVAIFGDLGA